jgi:protein SCO1/2
MRNLLKRDSTQFLVSVGAAMMIVIVLGLLAAFLPTWIEQYLNPPREIRGVPTNPPKPMPDFELTDQNGKALKLSDLRGKPILMFFGYTFCPDICPVTMADFRRVRTLLGDKASNVTFVMVSFDGERDSPEVMKRYVEAFDPTFIGLTGDPAKVATISADYGSFAELKKRVDGTQSDYIVGHSTYAYLLDAKGNWRITYPFGTAPNIIAQDVTRILAER